MVNGDAGPEKIGGGPGKKPRGRVKIWVLAHEGAHLLAPGVEGSNLAGPKRE